MTGEKIHPQFSQVIINNIPGSTANLGPFFDIAGAAISNWNLTVTLEPCSGREIDLQFQDATSPVSIPQGRVRGYAAVVALEQYLEKLGIKGQGLRLMLEDTSKNGFRSGGTGSSGAEAAAAITSAAVLFGQPASAKDIILAAAKGEPKEHKDNVALSVLGGIAFLTNVPGTSELFICRVPTPRNLGLAVFFSSHQKIGGTEATQSVLEEPVESSLLVRQVGRAVAGALSLKDGDVNGFLKFVSADEYHEPRRAEAGLYGNFSAEEFSSLKNYLLGYYRIALAVSGAGPSMVTWFNKLDYPQGVEDEPKEFITDWFAKRGIHMKMEAVSIQNRGALLNAQKAYPRSLIAKIDGLYNIRKFRSLGSPPL